MTQPFVAAALLAVLAGLLAGPVPRLMVRQSWLRKAPRAALVAWQAVTVGAILAALAVGPALMAGLMSSPWRVRVSLASVVAALSGLLLGRLLVSAHAIGSRLRELRRHHRDVVDIIANQHHDRVRVIEHATPTAYCLPGRDHRVVLSQGAIDTLPAEQVDAILAHERAHISGRHDLLLEFFSVVHHAVPEPIRCEAALREVQLLVEALADRRAVASVGALPTARALTALAHGVAPEAALAAAATTAPVRIRLIAAGDAPPLVRAGIYAYAALALALPPALLAAAWL